MAKDTGIPARELALYEQLVATNPKVERKGVTMPYTSFNGNMFSYLSKAGVLALRLSTADRDAFLTTYRTKLALKEYVEVPAALLANTRELEPFFAASYAYVRSLKPKATTRKKAPAKPAKKASNNNPKKPTKKPARRRA